MASQGAWNSTMKSITENTLLPISLVIAIIGGIGWLTNLSAETHANTESLREIRAEQAAYRNDVQNIRDAMASMREAMARIEERLKQRGK